MKTGSLSCSHCQNCARRDDWDFLKGFFEREKAQLDETDRLRLQHKEETTGLQLQVDALQLQHASTKAHLDDTQARLDNLMSDYLETHAVHAEVVDQSAERKKRLEQLESCYGAQCEVLTAQATEIKQKDKALDNAAAEVERLQGLLDAKTPVDIISRAASGASLSAPDATHRRARGICGPESSESRHNERRSSLSSHGYRRLATEQDTFSIPVTVTRRQSHHSALEMSYVSLDVSEESEGGELELFSDFEMSE
ncbi:hypothetical protein MBLNU13_g09047t1 [Cladosporium sp. NU13]